MFLSPVWNTAHSATPYPVTLLREFVEKIVIHESEILDGKRRGYLKEEHPARYSSLILTGKLWVYLADLIDHHIYKVQQLKKWRGYAEIKGILRYIG